jgi:hypothetical protein
LILGGELSPVIAGLTGLMILADLRGLITRDLTTRHGAVIAALWQRSAHEIGQQLDMLQPAVNFYLRRNHEKLMTKTELRKLLNELAEMGCVTASPFSYRLKDRVWLSLKS